MAHLDRPDTLDGAEKALKKHEDFVNTMAANEEKIISTLDSGQRLVDSGNLYSPKVKDKMDSIQDRSVWTYSTVVHADSFCTFHTVFQWPLPSLHYASISYIYCLVSYIIH